MPRSGVTVDADIEGDSGDTRARVFCEACGKRLFDLILKWDVVTESKFVTWGGPYGDSPEYEQEERKVNYRWALMRRCPRCTHLNGQETSGVRDKPLTPGGRWRCELASCGAFLGRIDSVRARLHLKCKCSSDLHISISDVIQTVQRNRGRFLYYLSDMEDDGIPF